MRKIALIMDNWKRYFTYGWPSGIMQRLHETNEEVNLYNFSSFGNWSRDKNYNTGEYNIYNLPKLSEFDGIILDLNNISSQEVFDEVVERAKDANVPVISISNEIDGFYYVGIDNYTTMKKIIAHLHEQHNCKKFWFILGPDNNYESNQREQALRDYVAEHGIDFQENDLIHVEVDYQSGAKAFQQLRECHEEMPDAIVCMNDSFAVDVCQAAMGAGYRVPDDFCVTGFEESSKAEFFQPRITTAAYKREDVGYACADLFIRLWKGEEIPKLNYTKVELVFEESCSCCSGKARNVREYLKEQILYEIDSAEFEEEILALEAEMKQCYTIEEMMYCIPQCIPSLRCDAMYLVLDDHINEYKKDPELGNWNICVMSDGFYIKGYPKKMQLRFAYEKDKRMDWGCREMENLFPMFDNSEGGKDYLFLPLHFGDQTVGFFAIQNATYLMEKQYLFQITNTLIRAMENLHKKEKVDFMNRQLSTLYMIDPLTGMYNRMGYQRMGENFFQIMHSGKKKILIFFVDMDRLKYINDTFGHEFGDYAICAIAKSIMKHSDKDAVPSRTGGDEFVVVQAFTTEEKAKEMIQNIRESMDKEAKEMNLPFPLSISVGSVVTDPEETLNFADYVKIADERMYEEKMKKKVARGQ